MPKAELEGQVRVREDALPPVLVGLQGAAEGRVDCQMNSPLRVFSPSPWMRESEGFSPCLELG